jgi:hypothetical protein
MKKITRVYVHLLFYLIALNISVVSATLFFHEAGHFFIGEYLGCKNIKIVLFDSSIFNTYTEMNCPPAAPLLLLELGGFLFTIPLSLFFLLFLNGFPEKNFFWVILGFNLLIGLADLTYFIKAFIFIFSFTILGTILIIIGENLLIDRFLIFYKNKLVDKK